MTSLLGAVTDGLTITEYKDWLIFVERLNGLVSSGQIRRIDPLESPRFSKWDEWYLDPKTGEIFVYGLPNATAMPFWKGFNTTADAGDRSAEVS